MHCFRSGNVTILHNSDYSGDAVIVVDDGNAPTETQVPARALLEFAAEYVRATRIAALENADPMGLLIGCNQ